MRKHYYICCLSIFLLIFSCSDTKKDTSINNNINDTIPYVPLITLGHLPFYIGVEVFFNDSVSGYFLLDSGTPKGNLRIDSTLFFNNIDISKFKKEEIKFDTHYWMGLYKGELHISVGNRKLDIAADRIYVVNYKHTAAKGYPYIGLIGEDLFLDKYTIIDMDNKRIAFVDSLIVDSTYTAIPMYPPKGNTEPPNRKYIEVAGFKDNEGNEKTGRFLFDTGCSPVGFLLKPSFGEDIPMTNTWNAQSRLIQNMDSLQIGNILVNNITVGKTFNPTEIQKFKTALANGDGLIGMPFILRFNMILDYKHNILYLKPSKYFEVDQKDYLM